MVSSSSSRCHCAGAQDQGGILVAIHWHCAGRHIVQHVDGHRHVVGNIRHSYTYLHRRVSGCSPAAHHLHIGMYGGCHLRRPRLAHILHHHHGIGWSRVQARSPRVVAVALRHNCRRRVVPDIRYRRLHTAARHRSLCSHFLDLRHGNAFLSIVGAEKNQQIKASACYNISNAIAAQASASAKA